MAVSPDKRTDTDAAIEAGKKLAAPDLAWHRGVAVKLLPGSNPSVTVASDVLRAVEERENHPARCRGSVFLRELESFAAYVNRMKIGETTIWADVETSQLIAVFNDHSPDHPGWKDHIARYFCPLSQEWQAWLDFSRKQRAQSEFADFIEDHVSDVIGSENYPSSIELVEMARGLQIYTRGKFTRKLDPTTGAYSMICSHEHDENSTRIPKAFRLGLRVFEGGRRYEVEARIRFSLVDGGSGARFAITLHRADEIKRDAFADVREEAGKNTGVRVFVGVP